MLIQRKHLSVTRHQACWRKALIALLHQCSWHLMRKYGGLILDVEQNQLQQQRCRSKYFHTVKGKKNRKQKILDPLEEWAQDHPGMLLSDMETLPAVRSWYLSIHVFWKWDLRKEEAQGAGLRSRNALKLTRLQKRCRLTKRRGGGVGWGRVGEEGKQWKWTAEDRRWKGREVEGGTCGGRRKAGTEAEGVKNGKLKEETLKQEITGEDVASNMGQKSQSKTQSLTFIRWLNSFPGKPHTACHYYCTISYLISFVCAHRPTLVEGSAFVDL